MRYLLTLLALTACAPPEPPPSSPDQCLRREIFQQCMAALPAGPVGAKYNDWDEVVAECDSIARSQAYRQNDVIKKECKS